ncbi:thioredoxin domain-containing protein [Flavihumibacter sp. RY-1]|uniref:Thioredoxin domain-containing protein n=1 Tax=Flavihumibacter fluminis TaxID=2909236 RepID=A0ABS9BKR9_9BACT|nr:thioredoxin domain-containing protein [Flavihumibacter fluminis]MCF1716292.1 thioredoxin domain-containing protein [Flavihumibacter fluminis]
MANRLAKETSPYLLQHAHNPVDWYPWGEEALETAKKLDRPILVSIGYAACHWCHVMERESFENPEVATLMNDRFINIKVDREERPDIDHIYMDALTSMTGSGGWPLNVFLTPEGRPFYGGTYYPPEAFHNLPSWTDVILAISKAWQERRGEMLQQAENLTQHLVQANRIGEGAGSGPDFHVEQLTQMAQVLLKNADKTDGGFGRAPKFPQTFSIAYLLRYAARFMDKSSRFTSKRKVESIHWKDGAFELAAEDALRQALLSLDKMIEGGIYDQLGGGFARYSTDNKWLVPHFEKMLYDQALLVSVLAEAYQLTGKTEYAVTIRETIGFLERELMSSEFGFYSALDADSEGEEGKFYVWEKGEVEELLGKDAAFACDWLGITSEGNWEGINILTKSRKRQELLEMGYCDQDQDKLNFRLEEIRQRLLEARKSRIRPGLDDKQLVSWNALMNSALSKAFAATGEERYRRLAEENMAWILRVFVGPDNGILHTYKMGKAQIPGFLDDYAYLVQALINLQEITGRTELLEEAKKLTEVIFRDFSSEDSPLFYYTNQQQTDVIVRKREVYDGAQPSGNAVMAFNIRYLGVIFERPDWSGRSASMTSVMAGSAVRYPGSFGCWAMEIMGWVDGCAEIVVVGEKADVLRNEIMANFIPYKVLQSATRENPAYPLLRHKPSAPDTLIYLCQSYNCLRPESAVDRFLEHL